MNGHLWAVYRFEFRRNLRRKGYLFATFGIPIIGILLLFGYQAIVAGGSINLPNLAGPDLGQSGAEVAGYVDHTGLITKPGDVIAFKNEEAANAALKAGTIDTYFIIPADYLDTGEVVQVMQTLSVSLIDEQAARQLILNSLGEGVNRDVPKRLSDPANFTVTNLGRAAAPVSGNFDTSFTLIYPFAIALMLSLFMTNGYLMQGVIEEKESRIVEILIASLRPSQLLIGKVLAFGTLGLLQLLIWVGAVVLVLQLANVLTALTVLAQLSLPLEALPLMLLYFVLAYLLFASAYGILGALSVSMREGPQFAVVFTLPAVAPLWFSAVFISTPNAPLAVALSLFPLTAPLAMMQRVLLSPVPGWQIAVSLSLLALTIIGMMWLAGRLFRVQTLLAGQLPRLRDLPRLVRG